MKIKIYTKDKIGNRYVLPFDSKDEALNHLNRTIKLNLSNRNSVYKVKWGNMDSNLNEVLISNWDKTVEFLKTL